jgi:catechol 2,3-dioxygenase
MYERLTPEYIPNTPLDPSVRIGHVHLKTADLGPIFDFYVTILGWQVMAKMDSALFLGTGGYHHHLAFNTWESKGSTPPPWGHTGLYHVAIAYPTRAALADALRRLLEASWPLEGTSDHGTHEALYLRDPDQNGLELYWDKPEAAWPVDHEGKLAFMSEPVDLGSLLGELEQ